MEKIPAWKNSRIDLLARLYNLIYVIPPAVKRPMRQKSLIVRLNLPQARGLRFGVRARDSQENNGMAPDKCSAPDSCDIIVLDAEADPARRSSLGSGPGAGLNCSCCCCKQPQRRGCSEPAKRRQQEVLQERLTSQLLLHRFEKQSRIHGTTVKQIRSEKDCVLGVLPCGYVLGGEGSVKTLTRKQA